jgi:F-box and leucine-rich repeat protein 2/20
MALLDNPAHSLQTLVLENCPLLDADAVVILLQAIQRSITELSIVDCAGVSTANLMEVVQRCQKLRKLTLGGPNVNNSVIQSIPRSSRVTHITIRGAGALTHTALVNLLQLPLQVLALHDCDRVSVPLVQFRNSCLESVILRNCQLVRDTSINNLTICCSNLKTIDCSQCSVHANFVYSWYARHSSPLIRYVNQRESARRFVGSELPNADSNFDVD